MTTFAGDSKYCNGKIHVTSIVQLSIVTRQNDCFFHYVFALRNHGHCVGPVDRIIRSQAIGCENETIDRSESIHVAYKFPAERVKRIGRTDLKQKIGGYFAAYRIKRARYPSINSTRTHTIRTYSAYYLTTDDPFIRWKRKIPRKITQPEYHRLPSQHRQTTSSLSS